MRTDSTEELITRLQSAIHYVVKNMLADAGPFALLDFPDHSNVGDSAIWLGEIAYFRRHHRTYPAYVCTLDNFSAEALELAVPTGPIFLHGGGNFGDLWPKHQELREQVLQRFPHRSVIQLPQSISYSDHLAVRRTADIISSHPDFTLLVRDFKSFAFAKEWFDCRVFLCPDMAFCLGSLNKPAPPTRSLLLLLRTDIEKVSALADAPQQLPSGALIADWLEDDPNMRTRVIRDTIIRLITHPDCRAVKRQYRRQMLYRRLAEARLDRGLTLLSSSEFVITDRLHAHILSTLLDLNQAYSLHLAA